MVREAESYAETPGRENGVRLTKKLVLDNSMCDELIEVKILMLREKKITVIDDNTKDGLSLNDLSNIECLMASHNLLKDISGVCQLVTLLELNLSFNYISDITGLEELTMLRSLFLSHNKIVIIEPLRALKSLKQIGLFHNQIMNGENALQVF